MTVKLKKLSEQVVVITGASSGIGMATAETAAKKGAKVVLAARSIHTLSELAAKIHAAGGQALEVECDVSDRMQVERVARMAVQKFGRIDTWINDAGMGLWGRLDETPEPDGKRLFEINFWGVVNGSLAAMPHLKAHGGALINVGSEVSDAYAPLQGMYTATKHAVKGWTDAYRVEIEEVDKAPVAITLIQPTAVDTPFPQHARNVTDQEAKLPSPMIGVQQVADAILECAETPTRSKKVGTMSVMNTLMAKFIPGLADKMSAPRVKDEHYNEPPRHPEGTLHQPSEATGVAQKEGTGGVEKK